ncbi:hypothetical protein J6590_074458 [Homalodisca vitripennis]|nr:hypothetical protein J6590_074458 [Homalodisca vitripennis]
MFLEISETWLTGSPYRRRAHSSRYSTRFTSSSPNVRLSHDSWAGSLHRCHGRLLRFSYLRTLFLCDTLL